jgi:hypothetical protein
MSEAGMIVNGMTCPFESVAVSECLPSLTQSSLGVVSP